MSEELKPTTPAEAVEWYLKERESELSEKSRENHRYRLKQFVKFCDENDIENMNAITGRNLHRFRTWRGQDFKPVHLPRQLQDLRGFLEVFSAPHADAPGTR